MPTNAAYHDPNIGIAFNNLAQMFQPPSPQDVVAGADAALKKQKLSELAQMFANAGQPGFNKDAFDQRAVLLGNGSIANGYYGVDQGNATTRRGQDVTAATSTANNLSDNQTRLMLPRYSPVPQGDIIPASTLSSQFGLPELPQVNGAPKPLSETEWQAQQDQRLLGTGQLSDQNLVDAIVGKDAPVKAVGGTGKQVYMSPGEAVRTGAVVAYPPDTGGLTVTTNPDGTTTVTQGKSLTEGQSKDAYYLNNGLNALPTIDEFGTALTSLPTALAGNVKVGGVNVGNYAKSSDYQKAEQAGRVFLNAILRKESGAAITPEEDLSYGDTYLPRPGDQPDTLAQKKLAREHAMVGIQLGLPATVILQMEKAGIIPSTGATVDGQAVPVSEPAAPTTKVIDGVTYTSDGQGGWDY
jgi:hypothetical protein